MLTFQQQCRCLHQGLVILALMKAATLLLKRQHLLFCRETHHSLHASALWRAHHLPPSTPFFRLCQKTYLKWEIPQEVASKLGDAKRRHS